jgi:hypothetical protein
MTRSGFGISAIFSSRALSPSALAASAFSSLARSFIAAFSSALNPLDFCVVFLVLIVPSCARWKSPCWVTSYPREFA